MNLFAALPELHSFGLVGVSAGVFRWNGGGGVVVVEGTNLDLSLVG